MGENGVDGIKHAVCLTRWESGVIPKQLRRRLFSFLIIHLIQERHCQQ